MKLTQIFCTVLIISACGLIKATMVIGVTALTSITALAATANVNGQDRQLQTLRVGGGGNNITLVTYNINVAPSSLNGLGIPTTASIQQANGGNIFHRTISNRRRNSDPSPISMTTTINSTAGMTCSTPATCGTVTIPFSKISWTMQDTDVHITTFNYNDTANQLFWYQEDSDPDRTGPLTRHENRAIYFFNNDQLLPAGQYDGTVFYNGTGP